MSYRDELEDAIDRDFEELRENVYLKAKERFKGLTLEEQVNELIEIYAQYKCSKITR